MTDTKERLYFDLDSKDWHGRPNEGLWAERIEGTTTPTYRLMNSPFFAREVSFLDTVRAVPRIDGRGLQFAGVVDRSGHSTYMILVPPNSSKFDKYWKKLQKHGCTFESKTMDISGGKRILYSVDVPDTADIYDVYSTLDDGEKSNVWMFQEGHVGHKLKSNSK
jgi:Domain of unknown function (DUF4265)